MEIIGDLEPVGGRASGGLRVGVHCVRRVWKWPAPCKCFWRCVWALRTYIVLLLTSIIFFGPCARLTCEPASEFREYMKAPALWAAALSACLTGT